MLAGQMTPNTEATLTEFAEAKTFANLIAVDHMLREFLTLIEASSQSSSKSI
jgi:hypothetical protein